jgi:hypothetical protein
MVHVLSSRAGGGYILRAFGYMLRALKSREREHCTLYGGSREQRVASSGAQALGRAVASRVRLHACLPSHRDDPLLRVSTEH